MIYPLIPYAIKGVCWYQGENDNGKADIYASTLTTLIDGWRSDWHEGDFPFLIVQIAPHKDMRPEIRNAQLQVVKNTKETALIVTTDCGDSADIHPAYKQPVGQRLALAARALAYGEKIEYSGPMIRSATIVDGNIELKFTHIADGLKTSEGPLTGFSIAGPDGKFFPANANISGKKVVLSHPSVHNPIHIRYGWSNVPHVNLINSAGLPASPFRIDF
jgi:sialate O-acetylesterase